MFRSSVRRLFSLLMAVMILLSTVMIGQVGPIHSDNVAWASAAQLISTDEHVLSDEQVALTDTQQTQDDEQQNKTDTQLNEIDTQVLQASEQPAVDNTETEALAEEYVRIKNKWTGNYLYEDESGVIRYGFTSFFLHKHRDGYSGTNCRLADQLPLILAPISAPRTSKPSKE